MILMSELVFREGFWVRADNMEQDLAVVRDIVQSDAYCTALLAGDAFNIVVDVGAHIGTFAALWHAKNPIAKIICVEACPENIPALQKNVGSFATVIHAACTYQTEPLGLLNAVRPQCESTGGSMIVPLNQLGTAPGQPGYQYWHDTRPVEHKPNMRDIACAEVVVLLHDGTTWRGQAASRWIFPPECGARRLPFGAGSLHAAALRLPCRSSADTR